MKPSTAMLVTTSAWLVASPALLYELRSTANKILTVPVDPQATILTVHVTPCVEEEDADYDAHIVANLDDEPETDVDESSLMAVEWIPGVGLVDRS